MSDPEPQTTGGSTVTLANDRAILRAVVQTLGLFLSEDPEVVEVFTILNRKQFEYQAMLEARVKDQEP